MGRPCLVACDLDGTLLTTDQRITARTVAAVAALTAAGGRFVVVTARPVRESAWVAETVDVDVLLCAGGGLVYDPVLRQVSHSATFTADQARGLLARLRTEFPGLRAGVDYADSCDLDPHFDMGNPGAADVNGAAPVSVLDQPVVKLLFQTDAVATDALAERVRAVLGGGAGPTVAVSCAAFVEVLPPGVNKASGLERLRGDAEYTVAIGDMPSDLPMLSWADTAVAMGNAHPAVLAACDHVTLGNDDDGVAEYLESLVERFRRGDPAHRTPTRPASRRG